MDFEEYPNAVLTLLASAFAALPKGPTDCSVCGWPRGAGLAALERAEKEAT